MPTEMELTLEQTQQGVSYEVSVLSDIEDSHDPMRYAQPPPATSKSEFIHNEDGNPAVSQHHDKLHGSDLCDSLLIKREHWKETWSDSIRIKLVPGMDQHSILQAWKSRARRFFLKLNLSDHKVDPHRIRKVSPNQTWGMTKRKHVGPAVTRPQVANLQEGVEIMLGLMIRRCARSLMSNTSQGNKLKSKKDH
ncbi:hypothetical protein Tco_0260858 [Tanacetum coccineum]